MDNNFLIKEAKQEVEQQDKELTLDALVKLIEEMNTYAAQVAEKELELKELKKKYNALNQQKIPYLLNSAGLSELKLADGRKVTVQEKYSPSVKDWDTFFEFMTRHGDDSLIDSVIKVGKLPANIIKRIKEFFFEQLELSVDVEQKVHHARMPGYIKELCFKDDADYTVEELNDYLHMISAERQGKTGVVVQNDAPLLEVFKYYTTKVK